MTTKTTLLLTALIFSGLSVYADNNAKSNSLLSGTLSSITQFIASGTNLPPLITLSPITQVVDAGTNVTLSISADGNALQYQWTFNGYMIPGETGPTLNLTNVTASSSGSYQAVVFNDGGFAKSAYAIVAVTAPIIYFADDFASRTSFRSISGVGIGNSQGATKEIGEPKTFSGVGSSVWITWIAPSNGVATFSTIGSSFDTVLAVYKGIIVTNLLQVALDDDSGGFYTSLVRFNASAGTAYQIYVGSRDNDGGIILLSWMLDPPTYTLPTITVAPTNITTIAGSPAALSVQFSSVSPLSIQWYHNGLAIPGATQNSLQWSQLTVADLGRYRVSLSSPKWTIQLQPVEIEFNSEGLSSVAARSKLFDSINSALVAH